ncbi:hypothetical protein B0T16DRAFT_431333 [Cercophora newfieldiana]|uniref:Uncharacterized protein n=1 Tax=Cercophora newfieldiana TaxID=92897 RepID=A0AA39XWV4_9PEZI|nr:hypothetical protein B0T16DRAFT_431333 [Cercophora newfieldiana]
MLFTDDEAPHLKNWIVKRIENTSDADADVLADYVLALLRHDGDIADVRKLCETEIPDFLKEDPTAFVNDVFETVAFKSYLPGAPPPPSKRAPPPPVANFAQQQHQLPPMPLPAGGLSYDDDMVMANAPPVAAAPQRGRKRGWNEGEGPQGAGDGGARPGKRAIRNARRGGRGGWGDDGQRAGWEAGGGGGQIPTVPGFPGFDPSAFDARKKCRDFETKGYCTRGNTCMFQHGDDPVYPPAGMFGGQRLVPPQGVEEYDPANALMVGGAFGVPNMMAQQPFSPDRSRRGGQKRRPRAPFSADGPVHDKTKSTIVVESIPEENFTEEQVREFFSQYGNIVEVSMQPYKRLAIVKYDNWASANAAYMSPKVIFENRFVKVFWFKDEESLLPPSVPTNGTPSSVTGSGEAGSAAALTPAEMEELVQKQEEAQKAHEEKMKKLQEVERQQQEIEKRQQELLVKQREAKALLEAKLAKRTGGAQNGENGAGTNTPKPTTQSEALRAKLAELEAEAKQLGINPDEADESSMWDSPSGFGGGRGRGGYYRARGFAPRGAFRGGFRGRGGQHAAYAAYSLDNRPKKVRIVGVDFTVPEKDEVLRQFLFGIGEFTDIQHTPTATEITFKDRKTAEGFFYGLSNKSIPGIDGQVEPSWVGGASTPSTSTLGTPGTLGHDTATRDHHYLGAQVNASKPSGIARQQQHPQHTNDTEDSTAAGGSGESVSSDKDVHITLEAPANPGYMDYDVAGDNQWDY